jgi:hypothetical protein
MVLVLTAAGSLRPGQGIRSNIRKTRPAGANYHRREVDAHMQRLRQSGPFPVA